MEKKQWDLIENIAEDKAVWQKFNDLFHFNPNPYNGEICPFDFSKINEPIVSYDIRSILVENFEAHDEKGNYRTTEQILILKSAFVECMGKDEFMYALDWQHSTFKYNPRIESEYSYYTAHSTLPDTRTYYPDFHLDGDYFFFVAKDFSWGYLTHPWQRKVWVYGSKLVELIKGQEENLGFIECTI